MGLHETRMAMRSKSALRRARPFGLLPFRALCVLFAGVWLACPLRALAQSDFHGTLHTKWDVSANRQIPAAPGDTVTTFDFTGNLVPECDWCLPTTVVCTEIWYRKGGVWDWKSSKNICFYTDKDGDYFRVLGHPTASEPTDDPARWINEGELVCDGGIGKYEGVICDWRYQSLGLGGGSARSEIKGTFFLRPHP